MGERMSDEEIRHLIECCALYPFGSDHSMAPIRLGEAVSALSEVLELRAEVELLRAAALRAISAAWSSGYAAAEADRDQGEDPCEVGCDVPEDYLDEALLEVSDG